MFARRKVKAFLQRYTMINSFNLNCLTVLRRLILYHVVNRTTESTVASLNNRQQKKHFVRCNKHSVLKDFSLKNSKLSLDFFQNNLFF